MKYADVSGKLADYRRQIAAIREQMREALAGVEPQAVDDYEFAGSEGKVRLSELFGEHEDLIVVHNMGVACSHCTLWADGYNGIHQHVVTRAGFVVSSPDRPSVQKRMAETRGWKFPMVSHEGGAFLLLGTLRGGWNMCPLCIGTAWLIAGGVSSAGGVATVAWRRWRGVR